MDFDLSFETTVPSGGGLSGQMLIAMPTIEDPRFERAVLFVCRHTAEQAVAIAVNKPVEGVSVAGLIERLGLAPGSAASDPVLIGGPVDTERGHVLHTDDYASPGATLVVGEGLSLTSTRDVLEAMADPLRRPRRALLALGYAGWDEGQLEHELTENVWLTCDADEDLLFDTDYEAKWGKALAKIGVSPASLTAFSGTA